MFVSREILAPRHWRAPIRVTLGAVAAAALIGLQFAPGARAAQGNTAPLPIKLPKPVFAGTAKDVVVGPEVEKPSGKPRPVPVAPADATNLALHKKVTSSTPKPFSGSLDLVTDGDKEARDGSAVELKPRLQWVQIDLGEAHQLYYILVWHFHQEPVIYHDVIVQASNDPNFIEGVTTIYNNDIDNSAGLGIGKDKEYWENYEGRLMDAKNVKARYVRLYSRGSTYRDPLNRYTEVEVWGSPK